MTWDVEEGVKFIGMWLISQTHPDDEGFDTTIESDGITQFRGILVLCVFTGEE